MAGRMIAAGACGGLARDRTPPRRETRAAIKKTDPKVGPNVTHAEAGGAPRRVCGRLWPQFCGDGFPIHQAIPFAAAASGPYSPTPDATICHRFCVEGRHSADARS